MTCHLEDFKEGGGGENTARDGMRALGKCFKACKAIDMRRGGKTASSKGTLSA